MRRGSCMAPENDLRREYFSILPLLPQGMLMFFSPSKAAPEFKSMREVLDDVLYTTQHAEVGRVPAEETAVSCLAVDIALICRLLTCVGCDKDMSYMWGRMA